MSDFNFDRALKLLNLRAEEELDAVVIKKAYLKASLKWHPDKNTTAQAEENFKVLDKGYNLLTKLAGRRSLEESDLDDIVSALQHSSYSTREKLFKAISARSSENGFNVKDAVLTALKDNSVVKVETGGYKYGTYGAGRNHGKYTVKAANDLSEEFLNLKGDSLKTAILSNFNASIAAVSTSQELVQLLADFKKSSEFKILATGQGWTTRMFNLDTTSIKTFESIVMKKHADIIEQEIKDLERAGKFAPK